MTYEELRQKIVAMNSVKRQEQAAAISVEMTYEKLASIISAMSPEEKQERVAIWWDEVDLTPGV